MTRDVLTKAFADMFNTTEEALREQMNLNSDWTMRDLPWMKREYFNQMVDIIGRENFKLVSGSTRNIKGDDTEYVRATLFINPEGRQNIKKYAEQINT